MDSTWIELSQPQIAAAKHKAYQVAIAFKVPNLIDDLAQEYLISLSKGNKSTCQQILIDIIRREFGRTDKSRRHTNALVSKNPKSLKRLKDKSTSLEDKPLFWLLSNLKNVNEIERGALILYFKYGLTYLEIGEVYSRTEGWACKIIKGAIKQIRQVSNGKANRVSKRNSRKAKPRKR